MTNGASMPFRDARWLLTPAPVAPLLYCHTQKILLTQSRATSVNFPLQQSLRPQKGNLWPVSVQRIGCMLSLVVFQIVLSELSLVVLIYSSQRKTLVMKSNVVCLMMGSPQAIFQLVSRCQHKGHFLKSGRRHKLGREESWRRHLRPLGIS